MSRDLKKKGNCATREKGRERSLYWEQFGVRFTVLRYDHPIVAFLIRVRVSEEASLRPLRPNLRLENTLLVGGGVAGCGWKRHTLVIMIDTIDHQE